MLSKFVEGTRKSLIRWHVAPLLLLGVLVHIMYMLIDKLINFPCGTDVATYTVFAGIVGGVLTAMFAAFKLLLTGVTREKTNDPEP